MTQQKDTETQLTNGQSIPDTENHLNQSKQNLKGNSLSFSKSLFGLVLLGMIVLASLLIWVAKIQVQIDQQQSDSKEQIEQIKQLLYDLQNNQNKQFDPNLVKTIAEIQNQQINQDIKINQLDSLVNNLQNFINSSIQNQKDQIENLKTQTITQNQNIENLQNNQQQLSSNINSIDIKIPKTILYDSFYSKDAWWDFVPVLNQIYTHPTAFAKIQIDRKSIVTLRLQGHMHSGNQHIYVFFMKDKKPIPPLLLGYDNEYWDSYLYTKNFEFDVLSLIYDIVVEPGTYLFEIGVISYLQFAFPERIRVFLPGLTAKVQELSTQ